MRSVLAAISLLLLPAITHAQSDLQLWTSAGLRYGLAPRIRLDAGLELRADNEVSRLGSILPSAGVTYDASDRIRLGVGYRYEYERDGNGTFEGAHRLHTDFLLRGDARRLRLTYRLRFQERLRNRSNGFDGTHTLRNRFGVSYDIGKPITPRANVEFFTRLGEEDDRSRLTQLRFTIGAEYGVRDYEIEVFYRLEKPADGRNDPDLHIIGVSYQLDLR